MSLHVFVCASCSRAVFPRRLLCPDCGGAEWRRETVEAGVLAAMADRGDVRIDAVHTAAGPLVIARLEGEPQPGGAVPFGEDDDVPVAGAA